MRLSLRRKTIVRSWRCWAGVEEIGSKNSVENDGPEKRCERKEFRLSTASRPGAGDGVAAP
jgi:hypothetical protein